MKRKIFCESPIGMIEAPQGIADKIIKETDEELLKNLYSDIGFIDPFRYSEARRRGLK